MMVFEDGLAQIIELPSTALTLILLSLWLPLIMSALVHLA
jgi:hypothetical protein